MLTVAYTHLYNMIITVGKITKADLLTRVRWINDPRVNEFMYFIFPVNLRTTTAWFDRIKSAPDRQDLVFKDEHGHILAMAGFTAINRHFSNAEYYIFVNPDLHGKGLGKSITSWMLDYAFSVLKIFKVYLYTDGDNKAALSVYRELGFVKEGHQRKHRLKNGKFKDKLIFGIFSDDWKASAKDRNERHTIISQHLASVA